MEIAHEIVDNWANNENFEKVEVPRGRLWLLEKSIAEALMRERVKTIKNRAD